jgi:hypothetical protein
LAKLSERWPTADAETPRLFAAANNQYDARYPLYEQLPRQMQVEFREVRVGAATKVELVYNGAPLGNQLTDNAHMDDGFRHHDVVHLTYAMMLGWSPVVRALLKRKRKSEPQIDEVEDGARDAVTEEAISVVVFGHAKDHSFF